MLMVAGDDGVGVVAAVVVDVGNGFINTFNQLDADDRS